jgi:RNA polymerase sigma-70 factor, ECF subfamily
VAERPPLADVVVGDSFAMARRVQFRDVTPSTLFGVRHRADAAYRRQYNRIYRYVRGRTETIEDAEDTTQNVYLRAAEHLGSRSQDETTPPAAAWLYSVARNNLIDEARRRARRPEALPLVDSNELRKLDEYDYGPNVAKVLRAAFKRLPETQRKVVMMRLLEGRTFAEVAGVLGISEASCKMRFARALRTMRDHFEKAGLEP